MSLARGGSPTIAEPVKVDWALAHAWGRELLTSLGADTQGAVQTMDHLLAAEDAGHPSHGLRMLISIALAVEHGHLDPAAQPVVEMTGSSVARIDGRRGLGPPIGRFATAEAIRLARVHGTSAVAVRAAGQMGRLAPFADTAASNACALFMCANDGGANQHVVPPGGIEGRLSTNPIAFGIPRPEPPHLIIDMATSSYAHGALDWLREAGRQLPEDALLRGEKDLILPMAGHKGFALGLMVEALAGALTGAGVVSPAPPPGSQGALIVAIDLAALGPAPEITRTLEAAIAWVRSASCVDGEPVRIPGEHRVAGAGVEVAIVAPVWSRLVELSAKLGVSLPPSREA